MNSVIDILACPFCKLGMDEIQARAMEYSIYFLLTLIYSLIGIIGFKVWRMMAREERDLVRLKPVPTTLDLQERREARETVSSP
jgi:hypothetical protein